MSQPTERRRRTSVSPLQYWLGIAATVGAVWAIVDKGLDKVVRWPDRVDMSIQKLTASVDRMEGVASEFVNNKHQTELRFQRIEDEMTRLGTALDRREDARRASNVPIFSRKGTTVQ